MRQGLEEGRQLGLQKGYEIGEGGGRDGRRRGSSNSSTTSRVGGMLTVALSVREGEGQGGMVEQKAAVAVAVASRCSKPVAAAGLRCQVVLPQ